MTQLQKQIARWRAHPKDVRFEEIDSVLMRFGCERRMKGSHAVYRLRSEAVVIPFHRPFVLPVYVRNALEMLERAGAIEEEGK